MAVSLRIFFLQLLRFFFCQVFGHIHFPSPAISSSSSSSSCCCILCSSSSLSASSADIEGIFWKLSKLSILHKNINKNKKRHHHVGDDFRVQLWRRRPLGQPHPAVPVTWGVKWKKKNGIVTTIHQNIPTCFTLQASKFKVKVFTLMYLGS